MTEKIPIFKYIYESQNDFEEIQKLHNQNQSKFQVKFINYYFYLFFFFKD